VKEGSQEEGNLRVERSYGSFMRRFRLPESVDVEGGLCLLVHVIWKAKAGGTGWGASAAAMRGCANVVLVFVNIPCSPCCASASWSTRRHSGLSEERRAHPHSAQEA
jgi:hypothetical protein